MWLRRAGLALCVSQLCEVRTPSFRAKARAVLNPGARGGKRPASSSDLGVVDDHTGVRHVPGDLHVHGDCTVDGQFYKPRADLCEFVEALDPEEAIPPGSVVGWRFGKGVTLRTAGAQVGAALPAPQRATLLPTSGPACNDPLQVQAVYGCTATALACRCALFWLGCTRGCRRCAVCAWGGSRAGVGRRELEPGAGAERARSRRRA